MLKGAAILMAPERVTSGCYSRLHRFTPMGVHQNLRSLLYDREARSRQARLFQMEPSRQHLHSNSADILGRQERAAELRASGLTVREVAQRLNCSPYVAQTLLNRAYDQRLGNCETGWLQGLPHRAARTLLTQGFRSKEDVADALASGRLTSDQPGVGQKTLGVLAAWLAEEVLAQATHAAGSSD